MSAVADERAIISVRGVRKQFELPKVPSFLALDDTSLDIRQGEFLALVGPSGCGKSTLLRLISGLLAPSAGEVQVGGRVVKGPQDDFSIVFQSPRLLSWRTVHDNVALPLMLGRRRRTTREEAKRKVGELLDLVQLGDFAKRFPHELSGGMQQRVAIARSLVTSPPVLMMDEPFGALDAFTREYLNEELLRIWQATGRTIVFVTHDMDEAAFLADRVAVMGKSPGRIIDIVDVALPRPRNSETRSTDQFFQTVREIRRSLGRAATGEQSGE